MRRRGLPARGDRGAGLQRRDPRPEAFNGVAILSKLPFDEVTPRLPGDDADDQARFIEAVVSTKSGVVRVASIYLPNGNPAGYRQISLQTQMDGAACSTIARERLKLEEPLVLAGDYNVIPAAARRPQSRRLGRRRAVPAADPRALSQR